MRIVGERLGRYLSNFASVIVTLVIYVVLSLVTYVLLVQELPTEKRPGFIAYEIATGGDPINFEADIQTHYWTWRWILLFHVVSWLIVPVLAATAVDAAFKTYEERRKRVSDQLSDRMEQILTKHSELSQEDAEKVTDRARAEMEKQSRTPQQE